MSVMIVYESMFGTTRRVAEAILAGIAHDSEPTMYEVNEAPRSVLDGTHLLIVGGPTHRFSMSWPSSRRQAAKYADGPLVSVGIGIREWIKGLDTVPADMMVATFDTRLARPRLPGSAARVAARRLRRHGAVVTVAPASFFVDGMTGPAARGELERARRWGAVLAGRVPSPDTTFDSEREDRS